MGCSSLFHYLKLAFQEHIKGDGVSEATLQNFHERVNNSYRTLTKKENDSLRSQNVTLKRGHMRNGLQETGNVYKICR